jgi:hypothetical protein
MNSTRFLRLALPLALAVSAVASPAFAQAQKVHSTVNATTKGMTATVYTTMPSTNAHSPEMAMDGDPATYFRSYYNMSDTDDMQISLGRSVAARSIRIVTGDADGMDTLTDGYVEASNDGSVYTRVGTFDSKGVAQITLPNTPVTDLRIRATRGVPTLVVREITIDSPTPIANVVRGAGRGFHDISQAPDLAKWAARAEQQLEEFWPETQALLYSPGFITPNKVNVLYRLGPGPGVTDVAAAGGGVITVNSKWSREHPEDTGLIVHESAHVIQAMSAYDPVWLVEGVADYIRWVKYEPQNQKQKFNPDKAKYSDSYRTTGTFLGWCELHYDSTLVTKLNHAVRFGNYKPALWKQFTGKDVDTLWSEFLVDYRKDPSQVLVAPMAPGDAPRALPVAKAGTSVPVSLAANFNASGFAKDGARFAGNSGFDLGGATFSANLLGASQTWKDVKFNLGPAAGNNIVAAQGQVLALPAGKYASLWILGAAVEGNQKAQEFKVSYTDGSSETTVQHVSDWYQPGSFPGESRAVKMDYRNMGDGSRDPRTFFAYSYGFKLDPAKTVQSLTLPSNPNVKVMAVTLAN